MPRAPVTQATITRAVNAVEAAGVEISRVQVAPNGTVVVIPAGGSLQFPKQNDWD